MAVYCGVCAVRIYSAEENEGSFPVDSSFDNAWDWSEANRSGVRYPRISYTCERCGPILRRAIASAAKEIAANNTEKIADRKAYMIHLEENRRRIEKERMEFQAAWEAEQARKR